MITITLTFMVETMQEVTENATAVARQLETIQIPPVGHMYVRSMANENGSTVHVKVEQMDPADELKIKQYKPKPSKELIKN